MMGMIIYSRHELFDICLNRNPNDAELNRMKGIFKPGVSQLLISNEIISHCDDVLIGGQFIKN